MKKKNLRTGKEYRVLSGVLSAAVLLTAVPVSAASETTEDTETVIVQEENLPEKGEIKESETFNEGTVSVDEKENMTDNLDVEEAAASESEEPQANEEEVGNSSMSSESDFIIEDGVLVSYDGTAIDVIIPAGVTAIGDNAFAWNMDIESIVIPEGVTQIGQDAFWNCTNLNSITIPNSVASIAWGAFNGSGWLYSMQERNPLVVVNHILVDGSTASGSVTIPSDVTVIGSHAFYSNKEITSVNIPDSVEKIEESAFSGCHSLKTMEIPDSVENMEKGIFSDCTGLEAVSLPNGISSISSVMFSGCSNLTSIQIPDSVRKIESQAFLDCRSLKNVEFPENLNYINYGAFRGCSNLKSLELPQKLYGIGTEAFAGCLNLNKVVIPSSVYQIEGMIGETPEVYKAFYKCPSVTIYGENNSYAQFYAKSNDIPFQSTGENTSGITLLAENFTGTPSDTQMELTWDKAPGADGYIILAAWDWVDSYREIAHIEDGSISSYTYSGSELKKIYSYVIQAYRVIDGEKVFGSYSEFKVNEETRQEQKIRMTVAAQENDLKNGSRTTTSKACTLKLGFDVDDPDLKLTYKTSDPKVATVKDGKITYQGVGSCTITVTAKETDACEEASLKIAVKVGKPGKPTFTPSAAKTAKKAFTITSSTVKGVDGWEVQYSVRKDFWRATTKNFPNTGTKLSRKTCKTVHSNKTYYVRVRGYQMVDGKKVYSAWSPVKTIRTK